MSVRKDMASSFSQYLRAKCEGFEDLEIDIRPLREGRITLDLRVRGEKKDTIRVSVPASRIFDGGRTEAQRQEFCSAENLMEFFLNRGELDEVTRMLLENLGESRIVRIDVVPELPWKPWSVGGRIYPKCL